MAQGLLLTVTGGTGASGRAVGPDNPVPFYTPAGYGVQFTDGTRYVDVVSFGTKNVAWNEGFALTGQDSNGTFFPLPLVAGGNAIPVQLGSGTNTIGTFVPSPNPVSLSTCIPITSAGTLVTLITAASAGQRNYILGVRPSNPTGTLTMASIFDGTFFKNNMALAANGGGNNAKWDYPGWGLTTTNALQGSLTVAVGTAWFNVDWYVGV